MADLRPKAVIQEARARWNRCNDASDAQRVSILEAKKFLAGDQWPDAIKIAREGHNAIQGQPTQPPRPCLVVDRLSPAVRLISNLIKNANFAIDVVPNGAGADQETADIFKGYVRRVQVLARENGPIEWAANDAIGSGLGWFRIRTEYVYESWDGPPAPEMYDQELRLERIANSLTVYCDPSAVTPTRSDAQFLFVTQDLDRDEFRRLYPKADLRGLEDFSSTGDKTAWGGWVDGDTIRIAEYWRIEYQNQTWYELDDGTIVPEQPKGEGAKVRRERTIRRPVVKGSKINAIEELEDLPWLGSRIPIIPILGEELNVDGQAVLRGVTQEGIGAQRMVNYTYSGAMEIFALGSKAPWLAAAGQIENYKGIWQTANLYNYSVLPYDPITIAGQSVPPPIRIDSEAPIQAAVALMMKSEDAIKATTNIQDPALGNYNPKDHSGKAIQALQSQSELSNSNYVDSVRRALLYAGALMIEVIPKITRPGQILHILGMDEQPEQVMVGQPFMKGPTGVPQPSPAPVTPALAKLSKGLHQFYDLNQGRYAVTVSVGKASATKREEGASALGELIPHLPEQMAMIAMPDYVEQLSFPGAQKIAENLRKALPPQFQTPEQQPGGPAPLPPQVQAQLQAGAQQIQQLQQMIQTDQVKQQAEMQKAQLDAQVQMQKAQLDNQTRMEIAKLQAQTALVGDEIKAAMADADRRIKQLEMMINAAQERRLEAADTVHQHQDRAHEVALTAMEHAHQRALAPPAQPEAGA